MADTAREFGKPVLIAALLVACAAGAISWYQVTTMRDTEQRGLRAYLVIQQFGVFCSDCGDTAALPDILTRVKNSIWLRIENVGQTPAREVVGSINIHSEPGKEGRLAANFAFQDLKKARFISKSDIGKDKYKDAIVELPGEELAAFKDAAAERTTVFVYGHIDYCDVFGAPHSTAYCFKYVPNAGLNLPICEVYNGEALPRGRC
jgi:hypothetical protein